MGGVQYEYFPAEYLQVCLTSYNLRRISDNLLWGRLLKGIRCVSQMSFHPIISHHIFEPHRQQAVSGLTQLPSDIFEGSGQQFHTFGLLWFPSSLCLFSLVLRRLRILCKPPITLRWVYHMANGRSTDGQDGSGCSRT